MPPADPVSAMLGLLREVGAGLQPTLLVQLAVAAVLGGLVAVVPGLRRPAPLAALGLAGAAVLYRRVLPGAALAAAGAFALAVLIARRGEPARRWRLAVPALLAVVAAFLLGQTLLADGGGFVSLGGGSITLVYLDMWLFLRLINYLWETGSGRLASPRAIPYLLWVALPFTCFGPMLRYSELEPQLDAPAEDLDGWRSAGWWRRLGGSLIRMLAGAVLAAIQTRLLAGGQASLALKLTVWLGTSPWGFYLTYSGFFAAMECLAVLWGLRLPPSFDRPFGRINLASFWAGWNMTVTSLIRDYLFFNRWGFRRTNVYLSTMIVFAAVGLWHGVHGYWLTWGLLHGAGFVAFLLWRRLATGLDRRPLPLSGELAGAPSRVATYLFVCACWVLPPQILALLGVGR